jgi:hypothetical protein
MIRTKGFKKFRLLASAVALLVSAVLMAGCINLIADEEDSFKPPEGMGAVSLSFLRSSARTILPPQDEKHESYRIIFKPMSGRPNIIWVLSESDDHDDIDVDMTLEAGKYQVEVIGYKDIEGTIPLGRARTGSKGGISGEQFNENNQFEEDLGELSSVEIIAGKHIILHITLKPIADDGKGTFKWDLINVDNIPEFHGTLMVSDYPTGSNPVTRTITQDTNLEGTFDISSGYKFVDLVLRTPGAEGERLMYKDIVHIYQNMTSSFDYTILNAIFFPSPPGARIIMRYTHPGDLGLAFSVDYDDSITNNQKNKGKSHANPITISRSANSLYPTDITIAVDGDFDEYSWYYGTTHFDSDNTPLTLSANDPRFNGLASGSTFVIYLEVVIEENGERVPYTFDDSRGVYIKIVN